MWKWIISGVAILVLAVLGGRELMLHKPPADTAAAADKEPATADKKPATVTDKEPTTVTDTAPTPPTKTKWTCDDIVVTDGTRGGGCAVAARVSGHRRVETTIKALQRIRNQDQMDKLNASVILKARNWITSHYGFRTPRVSIAGGTINGHKVDAMTAGDITAFLSSPATRADAGWEPAENSATRALDKRLAALEGPTSGRRLSGSAPSPADPLVPCPPPSAPASGTFTVP